MSPKAAELLLTRLRASVVAPGDDDEARSRLMPRLLDGKPARPPGPPPGVVPRVGAVLALLYPHAGELMLPLTVRSELLTNHRGEVSLPGGAADPDDPDLSWTALRESQEELGIAPEAIELWGTLTPVYIRPSNFQITPYVGYIAEPPELRPHAREVAQVLELPLRHLLHPETVVVEEWVRQGTPMLVPFYLFQGFKIWGATAIILSQLAARAAPILGTGKG
ncbi:MAG: coenzyme A pyrophosphatase [Herpetosiphonaceae bacterium]|nr:MAG: coenzyme A pyrophosphatase [Herpetosiphonaceae bacterium]